MGYNIPKWSSILNCCYDFPRINAPYLESSEQLHRFFHASLHKIKFHIFKSIYKCYFHGLIPFKYKNTCELCDKIQDTNKIVIIMVNYCSVFHDEVFDVFHKNYIPTINFFHLILILSGLLVQWNAGILKIIILMIMYQ